MLKTKVKKMEQKLTSAEINKVLCLYLYSDFRYRYVDYEYGVWAIGGNLSVTRLEKVLNDNSVDCIQLLLTPLSKISDEDAITIAKIFNDGYEWSINDRNEMFILVECKDYFIWIYFDDDSLISFEERYYGKENIEAHGGETDSVSSYGIVDIIDKFRELGYALPYKGKSLFEWGIAIEKP